MIKTKESQKADKAYLKAIEEIEKDKINEIKVIVKQVLEGIMGAEKEKKAAEEKLNSLKQDLNDIRAGKIDKIKARHADLKKEHKPVPFDIEKLQTAFTINNQDSVKSWPNVKTNLSTIGATATTGTFNLSDGTVVNIT